MPKRTFWATVGYGLGLGTSLYVQRRVRRTVRRYVPEDVRREVAVRGSELVRRARITGNEVVAAVREGRQAMREEEALLRAEYGLAARRRSVPAGRPG